MRLRNRVNTFLFLTSTLTTFPSYLYATNIPLFQNISSPTCAQFLKNEAIKDFIFSFLRKLQDPKTNTPSIQKTYSSGLTLYEKNLTQKLNKGDRLCLLSVLYSLSETPNGTAADQLLAEWYTSDKLNDSAQQEFYNDLNLIKDKKDSDSFAKQVIEKLESYSSN